MTPVRFFRLALFPILLLSAAGCEDTTSPGDLGDLDPAELAAALNDLVSPLQASTEASANLRAAASDLTDAGVQFHSTAPVLRLQALRAGWVDPRLRSGVPLLPVRFPPEITGRTFAFVLQANAWQVDESRAGAPADGVGVVWYDLDGTGELIFPLVERGVIDLRPREGGASDSLVTVVTETREEGSTTLLEFVQDREVAGGDVRTETFRAEGVYTDGSAAVEFTIHSDESEDTVSGVQEYALDITLDGSDASYAMRSEGSGDSGSGAFEDRLRATAIHQGTSTVLDLVFQGTGDGENEASGTLTHEGAVIANVDIVGNTFEFSPVDGGSFSAAQGSQLNLLFRAMTLNGFNVLFKLPLFLP